MTELSDLTLGQRVAALRRQRGLSQRDLATELGRSESWVSQVERDVLLVERMSMLQSLADALGVSTRELRPETVVHEDRRSRAYGAELDALRLTLSGHPTPSLLLRPEAFKSPNLTTLAAAVDEVWNFVHASQFAALATRLVALLPDLERTVRVTRGRTRTRAMHLLARTYQAASAAFARLDEADASWVTADRAISAAEHSGDPFAVFAGCYRLAHAFITLRRPEQAEHVAHEALNALQPVIDGEDTPPEALSLYGAMHLVLAIVNAREGQRIGSRAHIQDARRIAARLGADRNDYDTEFGPANVELHAVATAVDLGDAGEALAVAADVTPDGLSPERRSRLQIDLARAHTQRRHIGDAVTALLEAERLAPEQVQSHAFARDTIRDLLSLSGRRASPELLDLAKRTGVIL